MTPYPHTSKKFKILDFWLLISLSDLKKYLVEKAIDRLENLVGADLGDYTSVYINKIRAVSINKNPA
jgi:hypothetical protein